VGWNISPAHTAGLSPAPFCFGLEHQPSPRGWAESSPFHFLFVFLFSFLFCVFFYFILLSIYIFLKVVIFAWIFYVISTNIGLYFYILKIQIQY
jgi:hypothetical protein